MYILETSMTLKFFQTELSVICSEEKPQMNKGKKSNIYDHT